MFAHFLTCACSPEAASADQVHHGERFRCLAATGVQQVDCAVSSAQEDEKSGRVVNKHESMRQAGGWLATKGTAGSSMLQPAPREGTQGSETSGSLRNVSGLICT